MGAFMTRTAICVLIGSLAGPVLAGVGLPMGLSAQEEVAVEPGDRLVVENLSGSLAIRGWDESRVSFRSADEEVRLARQGGRVTLERAGRRGPRGSVGGELRVPRAMDLRLGGLELDVLLEDVDGTARIHVVEGDLGLRRTGGDIEARTLDGEIRVEDARGSLVLSAQSDDVTVRGLQGARLQVQSGDGDLTLVEIEVDRLEAETLDGDVALQVDFRAGAVYRVSVHDGDATIAIPRGAGVRGRVATFDGDFVTDIPVTVNRFEGGRGFEFEIGDGRAELEVEVFDGEIRLVETLP